MEQAVVGAREQQLRPFALHARGPGDEEAMTGQVLAEVLLACRHLVVLEATRCVLPSCQPLGGFLDAKVADRIAGAGEEQAPVGGVGGRLRQAELSEQLLPAEALRQHVDQEDRPVRTPEVDHPDGQPAAEGMRVPGVDVLDRPGGVVAGMGGGAPTLGRRTGEVDDAHVAPSAVRMQFDRAVISHIGGFLYKA